MDVFEGENMQTQYYVLGYQIDLYFHNYKPAIEVNEINHCYIRIDNEIKRQKVLEKRLTVNLLELILMSAILIYLKP